MSSQQSFESRLGRFNNGLALLQTWSDYLPSNPLITTASLLTFATDVLAMNELVATSLTKLSDKRNERKSKVFKSKTSDENCLQSRLDNIRNYLKAEFGKASGAYQKVNALYKHITPQRSKKKEITEPQGEEKSTSERSFAAVVGYGDEVYAIINSLGAAYSPSNPAITTANFHTLLNFHKILNKDIAVESKDYRDAVKEREDLYAGQEGLDERIKMIRSYLASFTGSKKGRKYIEYTQAVKGT